MHELTIVRMRGDQRVGRVRLPPDLLRAPMTVTAPAALAGAEALAEVDAVRERMRGVAREALGVPGTDKTVALRAGLKAAGVGWYPLVALSALVIVDQLQAYAFFVLGPEISSTLGISKGALAALSDPEDPGHHARRRCRRRPSSRSTAAAAWSASSTRSPGASARCFTGLVVGGLGAGRRAAGRRRDDRHGRGHAHAAADGLPPARTSGCACCRSTAAPTPSATSPRPLLVALLTAVLGLHVARHLHRPRRGLAARRRRQPAAARPRRRAVGQRAACARPSPASTPPVEEVKLGFFEVCAACCSSRRCAGSSRPAPCRRVPGAAQHLLLLLPRGALGSRARWACAVLRRAAAVRHGRLRAWSDVAATRCSSATRPASSRSPPSLLGVGTALIADLGVLAVARSAWSSCSACGTACFALLVVSLTMTLLSIVPASMRPHAAALQGIFTAAVGGFGGILLLGGVEQTFGTTGRHRHARSSPAWRRPRCCGPRPAPSTPTSTAWSTSSSRRRSCGVLRQSRHAPAAAGVPRHRLLLRPAAGAVRRRLHRRRGRDGRAARHQRRRQVDAAARHLRRRAADTRARCASTAPTSPTSTPSAASRSGITQIPGGKAVFGPMTSSTTCASTASATAATATRSSAGIEESFAAFPRLAERRDQLASTLSGGEQQMLALSKALHRPAPAAAHRRAVARPGARRSSASCSRWCAHQRRRDGGRARRAVGEHRAVDGRPRLLHGEGRDALRRAGRATCSAATTCCARCSSKARARASRAMSDLVSTAADPRARPRHRHGLRPARGRPACSSTARTGSSTSPTARSARSVRRVFGVAVVKWHIPYWVALLPAMAVSAAHRRRSPRSASSGACATRPSSCRWSPRWASAQVLLSLSTRHQRLGARTARPSRSRRACRRSASAPCWSPRPTPGC